MELKLIAGGDCGRDDCPTIFMTDKGTIAIKGYVVHGKKTVSGEAVVEIPMTVFLEACPFTGRAAMSRR